MWIRILDVERDIYLAICYFLAKGSNCVVEGDPYLVIYDDIMEFSGLEEVMLTSGLQCQDRHNPLIHPMRCFRTLDIQRTLEDRVWEVFGSHGRRTRACHSKCYA